MTIYKKEIQELLKKAKDAEKSEDAIRFSQAALNAAHVQRVLFDSKMKTKQYSYVVNGSGPSDLLFNQVM